MAEGKEIAVRVALRARPLVAKEIKDGSQNCIHFVPNEPQVVIGQDKAFTFDYVFPGDSKQEALYEAAISDRIDYLFKGYNVTVLAYGQTGSGKTYTMGTAYNSEAGDEESKFGVIQRAVTDIFSGIGERSETAEFLIKVSFLEVYKEDVFDLLQKNDSPISIREDHDGIKVVGLTEQPVTSPSETFQALELGSRSRTTASTAMNTRSSRSHAIFTIILEQRSLLDSSDTTIAKFHLVDLAGSERANKTGALGDRFKEGVNINRGLLALGNVISSLCDNNSHVPYRDSKLTRLLQDSLGGNSHTIMIACVSPADSNFDETVNTLRYADRARKIKNKPIVNRDRHNDEVVQLRQQIQALQNQMIRNPSLSCKELEEEKKKNAENVRVLLERNKLLESENVRLARELQHSLDQTTALCEKAMMAEHGKEKLILKLEEIQTRTQKTIEALMELSGDDPEYQSQLQLLKDWQSKIIEIKCDQLQKDEEFSMYSPAKKLQSGSPVTQDADCLPYMNGGNCSPCDFDENENNFHMKSTLKQAAMSRELEELERALALKEEIASKMQESDSQMTVMRIQFENNLKQMEEEINNLQKEKEELLNTLKAVHASNNVGKVSEQRRKRLQELESQISDMKKQMQEKSRILKMKQEAERKVNHLQQEIQMMKSTRVKLLRQIKEEAERYRALKKEKEREVASLKQKDRKRQYAMTKLQQEFDKQKIVLKRKMEEASAANRRLNDALQQQKRVAERRAKEKQQSMMGIGSRVQQWLAQEIEVVLRSKEAQHHLQILLDDRKTITEQLESLQKSLDSIEPPEKKKCRTSDSSSSDEGSLNEKTETLQQIDTLKQEFEIRNIQIADLQQKILDADQDEKMKHRWDTIQSMVESKCAMKWLFENVVSAKLESILQDSNNNYRVDILEGQAKHYKAQLNSEKEEKEKIWKYIKELKLSHAEKLSKVVRENEDKTIYLLKQLNSSKNSDTSMDQSSSLMERIKFQEAEIERLSYMNDELQKKEAEIDDLKQQLELARKGSRPKLLHKFHDLGDDHMNKTVIIKKKESSMMGEFLEQEFPSDDSDSANDENDPDFRATPMYKRKRNTFRKNNSDPQEYDRSRSSKVVTSLGCSCKFSCGTRRCGCNKQGRFCNQLCRCKLETCCNQDSGNASNSNESDSQVGINTTFLHSKSPSENSQHVLTEVNSMAVDVTNRETPPTMEKNGSEDVFLCPVAPIVPRKRTPEDSTSLINESGIKRTFHEKPQRYFSSVRP